MPGDELAKDKWPLVGNVKYIDMSLRYRPNLPTAVNNVNLDIIGGENVGVIGRTGAGKSTLMVALFRLVDACNGKILIDESTSQTLVCKIYGKNCYYSPT